MAYRVNTESLKGSAAQVKTIAGGFESQLASLQSLVDATASEGEGPAKDSFLETYSKYKTSMEAFIQSLNVYSSAMTAYADDMDQATLAGSQRFNSI